MFQMFSKTIGDLWVESAFSTITLSQVIMLVISFFLMYLAIVRKYEPMLLLPIAFGMCLTNLPGANMYHPEMWDKVNMLAADGSLDQRIDYSNILNHGGLLDILYIGVKSQLFPPLIFLGIGCMTDFGPLIANPKSFFLGAAAQAGIFFTFLAAGALALIGNPEMTFTLKEMAAIANIGGADGPTAIYLASKLAPHMLGSIAIAAYSYMALVPVIQPPIMRALTTKKERAIVMEQLRVVTKREKIFFPVIVTVIVSAVVPAAAPLVGSLMLGNIMRESGAVDRLVKTASNELMNIIVIFLGVVVGATATAERFITVKTILIIILGLIAFAVGTGSGVLLGKLMCKLSGGKINPLIGSAGVSAVPMAARVSQKVGQEENPSNYLLMHAMGPNVAGVVGSAVAAGVLLSILK